eukprot:m.11608 g.11608  ORF g.11608 m.11608 type:complete len:503 (+) comp3865_c0_seq2:95-1603(+)
MAQLFLFFIVVVFVAVFGLLMAPLPSNAIPAGFQATLTNKGIDYARQVAIPIIQKDLENLSIPDISGDASTPVGHIDYYLTNIKATSVNLGTSSIVTSTSGITASISGVSIGLGADWSYREKSWPHVKDHGSADISASSISLSINIVTSLSSTHEPQIAINQCSSNIGHLDIKFHGGASWLYNLFTSLIADVVKKELNKELCSEIETSLVAAGNKALASLPESITLDACSLIDFEFLEAPQTTSSYLLTNHKGEFFQVTQPSKEAPFSPPNLPNPVNPTRMFYIALSDYLFKTAGWVYAQCGVLDFFVQPGDVPPGWPVSLNTNSIGKLLPNLEKLYPNMPMDLWINASTTLPLDVVITNNSATANIAFVMSAYVVTPTDNKTEVFSLGLNVSATAEAWVSSDHFLHMNLTFLNVEIDVLNTNIGKIDVSVLDSVIQLFCKSILLPGLNKAIGKGIPLPTIDGVSFVNSQVLFNPGYLVIDTDISYNPSILFPKVSYDGVNL